MAQQQRPRQSRFGQAQQAQTTGGQTTQQGQQPAQQQAQRMDQPLEDALSNEMRVALHDFVQAATACEWCADQCVDEGPQMAECIRLCRDVADLASLNVSFISRDSIFGPAVAETFAYAAEECARECAQHHHEHCQECAHVLGRAVDSTHRLLDSIGYHSQGQVQQPQSQ